MKYLPFLALINIVCIIHVQTYAQEADNSSAGENHRNQLLSGDQLQLQAEQKTRKIDTEALKLKIDNEPDLVLIDIRTDAEIKRMGGFIDVPQNVNIPRSWLEFRVQSTATDKHTPIVVYCGAGYRSAFAAETLQTIGYSNVSNYSEGYLGWKKSHQSTKK